jgi:hypothetical protein
MRTFLVVALGFANAARDDSSTSLDIILINRVNTGPEKKADKIERPIVKEQMDHALPLKKDESDRYKYLELRGIIKNLIKQFLKEKSEDAEIKELVKHLNYTGRDEGMGDEGRKKDGEAKHSGTEHERDLTKNDSAKNSLIRDEPAGNFLVSPQPKSFDLSELKKFIASESKALEENSPHTPQIEPEALARISIIPGGFNLFCQVINNLPLIREKIANRKAIGKIANVLVYGGESLTDYWGRLRFFREGDRYVDDTGYFEGKHVEKFADILEQGRLTDVGLFQSKDAAESEIKSNVISMKMLYNEIAKAREVRLEKLIEEKCSLSAVEELIYFSNYSGPTSKTESVNVCICSDSFCREPCKTIMVVEKQLSS